MCILLQSRIQVLERLLKPRALKWLQKRSAKTQAFALAWRIVWINMRSWSEAARLRNFDNFLLLNRFLRLSVNENLLLLSFVSHFFHFVLCIWESEQYLARWISAYLIYGDHQRGFIPFVQMFFGVLFSYYRTAKKRTGWSLTYHSWNTTDLKIIGLFLLSFKFTSFIFLSQRRDYVIFRHAAKKLLDFLFSVCFRSLWNIPKKKRKRQGIRGGSQVISCRHQWVYLIYLL